MVKNAWSYSILLVLLVACAQVKNLPGGTKDTQAPVLLKCSPDSLSTNFNQNGFTMVWNEYLVLNNINQELVVSPPIQPAPQVKLKNKTISVSWTDTLAANTTYVFNFGAGITDLTEGNKANEAMYVFSTGNQIDSLSLRGQATDAWTNTPMKQKRIVLYQADSLITSRNAKPSSIGLTKDNGSFVLPYLRSGSFSVFAIDDANSNYQWDEGESVGFLPNQVSPAWHDSTAHRLVMSTPRANKPLVGEYKIDSLGRVAFAWDHYFKGISISPLTPGVTATWKAQKDSVIAWIKAVELDKNIEIKIAADTLVLDTITLKVFSDATKQPLKLESKPNDRLLPKSPWIVNANQTLTSVDAAKFQLKRDSVVVGTPAFSFTNNQVQLALNGAAGSKYTLKLLPGALVGAYGSTNDTLDFSFSVLSAEELGVLNLTIQAENLSKGAYVVLLDSKQNEVFRCPYIANKPIPITNIIPGEHMLKLVEDLNENGMWDPANFTERVQPERVWTYSQKLNIRANWELNQTWKIEE